MEVGDKDWGCPEKRLARQRTIVEPYRQYFGDSLPVGKQYWTIAGECSRDGKPRDGCEPDQMINKVGLIKPEQYRGVEKERKIYELNKQVYPGLTWFHGDFYETMRQASIRDEFNPGIVNVDLISSVNSDGMCVANILALLTKTTSNCMVIVNLITKIRAYSATPSHILETLGKQHQFRWAIEQGDWSIGEYWQYPGSGKRRHTCQMTTQLFLKR